MAVLHDWVARRADGSVLSRSEFLATSNLPKHSVREMLVSVDAGQVRTIVDPAKGETVRVFTRRTISSGGDGAGTGDTVVVEVAPDPERPDRFVRLYIGKEIILSTEDLYG